MSMRLPFPFLNSVTVAVWRLVLRHAVWFLQHLANVAAKSVIVMLTAAQPLRRLMLPGLVLVLLTGLISTALFIN